MNTFDINPRSLSLVAGKYQENLIFFPFEILGSCLERIGSKGRAAVIAELFVRYYMSGNSKYTDIVNRFLVDGEALEFNGLLPVSHRENLGQEILDCELWQPCNDFSRLCRDTVRRRFQLLFKVEGLIPIFLKDETEKSFLLPFSFEDNVSGIARVYDMNGHEIQEWTGYINELGITRNVRIHCHCLDDQPFEGTSMMLPLQMAWWRRQDNDDCLLPYNPFGIVATGAFDKNGLLVSVELKSKAKAVKEGLWKAAFIYPQNGEAISLELQCKKLLPAISKNAVKQEIRDLVEQRVDWNRVYASRRLKELGREVRKWKVSHWRELISSLERASAAFNEYEDAENVLLNLMFQSEAHCHCGNTARAKEINEEALLFAEEHDQRTGDNEFLYFILRLEIEQLVLHQDEEEFEMIAGPSNKLEQRLRKFEESGGDEKLANDLWMRYCGTMGQIHICATLLELEGFSQKKAKEYFRQAIEHAIKTDDDAEKAQDFNYMVYYHSIFEPGRKTEQRALNAAKSKISELKKNGNNAYERNQFFFLRYYALSLYRQVLQGNVPVIPDIDEFTPMFRDGKEGEEGEEDWLQATVGKYLGAVYAANGDLQNAEERFEKAISAIGDDKQGIILFIKMTVCAEAYRSLHKEVYLQKAREILMKVSASMPSYGSLPVWKRYIESPDGDFPGLKYWY